MKFQKKNAADLSQTDCANMFQNDKLFNDTNIRKISQCAYKVSSYFAKILLLLRYFCFCG